MCVLTNGEYKYSPAFYKKKSSLQKILFSNFVKEPFKNRRIRYYYTI